MKRIKSIIPLVFTMYISGCWAANGSIQFSIDETASATVEISDSKVLYAISKGHENRTGEFEVQTETTKNVAYADYNFDGETDFSVWYVDEGMGTYTIHRVFLYSKDSPTFIEFPPKCGDEFINLRIDEKRKTLVSTYYLDNVPRICTTTLPKRPR